MMSMFSLRDCTSDGVYVPCIYALVRVTIGDSGVCCCVYV